MYPLIFKTSRSIAWKRIVFMASDLNHWWMYFWPRILWWPTGSPALRYHGNRYFNAYWPLPVSHVNVLIDLWPRLPWSVKGGGGPQDPRLILYIHYFFFEKYKFHKILKKYGQSRFVGRDGRSKFLSFYTSTLLLVHFSQKIFMGTFPLRKEAHGKNLFSAYSC